MKKEITGKTLGGEKRVYTFELMGVRDNVMVPYVYWSKLESNEKALSIFSSADNLTQVDLIRLIPAVFSHDDIRDIARLVLSGASVTLDTGEKFDLDENGFADYMLGDPIEYFVAIFYGLFANYPKYIGPLLESGTEDNLTTPGGKE